MSKRDPAILISDIKETAAKIARYIAGLDREGFLSREETTDAVIRNLTIIGEAVTQLSPEFRDSHPNIPWRKIAGLRNRVIHNYAGVDLELIWNVVTTSLPELIEQLTAM